MKQICIVCFANYCRSPVAERIIQHILKDRGIKIISAGLNPIPKASMDQRSINFLLKNNYSTSFHSPRKITHEIVRESDVIYAMDIFILMELNNKFKNSKDKIKLINHNSPKLIIHDPYHFDTSKYEKVLMDLEKTCFSLKL